MNFSFIAEKVLELSLKRSKPVRYTQKKRRISMIIMGPGRDTFKLSIVRELSSDLVGKLAH